MVNRVTPLALAAAILAGCGGGGEGGVGKTPPPVTYAEYQALDQSLRATYGGQAFTDPATLPTVGGATYTGVMTLTTGPAVGSLALGGALTLNANFGGQTISGRADTFVDQTDQAYSGRLDLTNGAIDVNADPNLAYTFSADLDGTLTGGGVSLTIDADLFGDFLGAAADSATGVVSGSVTGGGGSDFVYGDFIAAE